MNQIRKIFPLLLASATFAPLLGARAESGGLPRHVAEKIEAVSEAVASTPDAGTPEVELKNEDWYYQNFWLRLRPKGGWDFPGIGELLIIPEVELLWQREFPEGWEGYTPPAEAHRT